MFEIFETEKLINLNILVYLLVKKMTIILIVELKINLMIHGDNCLRECLLLGNTNWNAERIISRLVFAIGNRLLVNLVYAVMKTHYINT